MKNLFEPAQVEEVKRRLTLLQPTSQRQWGKMTAPQMLAHCSSGVEMAMGKICPKRVFIGRLIGGIIKPMAFRDDEPMRPNSPTAKEIVVQDERDLETERERLRAWIDEFTAAGPAGCTTHPHAFFGKLTPDQWAILMYKHLDHHFRQFSV